MIQRIRRLASSCLIVAALALTGAGMVACTQGPTTEQRSGAYAIGSEVGVALAFAVPEVSKYTHTFAAAVRAVSGPTAPSPAVIQATVTSWASLLPVSDAAKAKAVTFVASRYQALYGRIVHVDNALEFVLAFADGLDGVPLTAVKPAAGVA